jgi:hypothetical protein
MNPAARPKMRLDRCPPGFRVFGHFDPLEAERVLKHFETEHIRFRVGRAEGLDLSLRATRLRHYLGI